MPALDMLSPAALGFRHFLCLDCGFNTISELGHYYMLRDELWAAVNPAGDGMLCLPCLERRLGREVKDEDFALTPREMAIAAVKVMAISVRYLHGGSTAIDLTPEEMEIAAALDGRELELVKRQWPDGGVFYVVAGDSEACAFDTLGELKQYVECDLRRRRP